jgi:hypothetical protein
MLGMTKNVQFCEGIDLSQPFVDSIALLRRIDSLFCFFGKIQLHGRKTRHADQLPLSSKISDARIKLDIFGDYSTCGCKDRRTDSR